jgi:arginine deiminase
MPDWGVSSEVGRLRKVLVHRPGREHRWTLPWNKDALLFDDVLDVEEARAEHEGFTAKMVNQGVEVLFVTDLLRQVCADSAKTEEIYRDVLDEEEKKRIGEENLSLLKPHHLICGYPDDFPEAEDGIAIFPCPNLYFMRDPAFAVPGAIVVSSPRKRARRREARLMAALFAGHPEFTGKKYNDKILWAAEEIADKPGNQKPFIEGGDVHVVDDETVLIGISERTNELGADHLIRYLFEETTVERVLKITLPAQREFMHLDTVLTFVDRKRVLTMPYLWDRPELYEQVHKHAIRQRLRFEPELAGNGNGQKPLSFRSSMELITRSKDHQPRSGQTYDNVLDGLHELGIIDREATILVAGTEKYATPQDHVMAALREQWSDAANTLALSPGKVMAYHRNDGTFRSLEASNLDVVTIPGGELVRGRGGTRCMTMPLVRESA